jgi:adenine-specific DNA-methyltransferase
MDRKQKLELTWIGKYDEIKVEPRILLEDKSKGYGDQNTENMLIHGDNLLALKALEQDFAGKIKCIYIDPPFNTGARINSDGEEVGYEDEDGIEHSEWLNMMSNRLKLLKSLLKDGGTIVIHLDDNEMAYCKILLDEIFGRQNYICSNTITMTTNDPSGFKAYYGSKNLLSAQTLLDLPHDKAGFQYCHRGFACWPGLGFLSCYALA